MSPKFCPKCGALLRANQDFCIACGTQLDAWLGTGEGDAPENRPGEVTTIMNRINLSVDQGIASPEPEHVASETPAVEPRPDAQDHPEEAVAPAAEEFEEAVRHEPEPVSPEANVRDHEEPYGFGGRSSQDEGASVYDPPEGQVISPIAVDPHRAERFKGESEWEGNNHRYLIIIGVVTLVAIGLIFTMMHSCRGTNTDPQAQNVEKIVNGTAQSGRNESNSDSNAASEGEQKKSDEQKQETPEESAAEKAAHEKVKSAHSSLSTSAKQVRDAIENYRKMYSYRRADRETAYQTTQELAQSLADAKTELEEAAIPSSSAYYDASERLLTCYDCLVTVMDEVNSFWALDLEYNAPDTHPDLLTIPFEESCGNNGTIGAALKKYDSNYRAVTV